MQEQDGSDTVSEDPLSVSRNDTAAEGEGEGEEEEIREVHVVVDSPRLGSVGSSSGLSIDDDASNSLVFGADVTTGYSFKYFTNTS